MPLLYRHGNIPNTEEYKHLPKKSTPSCQKPELHVTFTRERTGAPAQEKKETQTRKRHVCNWKLTGCAEVLHQPKAPRLRSNVGKFTTFSRKHLKRTMITGRLVPQADSAVSFHPLQRPLSHSARSGGEEGGERVIRSRTASDITAPSTDEDWTGSVTSQSWGKRAGVV